MPQQPLLAPEAAAVAGELWAAAAADDAVAGDDDGDRIAAVGGADGAHGLEVASGGWDAAQVEDVVRLGGGMAGVEMMDSVEERATSCFQRGNDPIGISV